MAGVLCGYISCIKALDWLRPRATLLSPLLRIKLWGSSKGVAAGHMQPRKQVCKAAGALCVSRVGGVL